MSSILWSIIVTKEFHTPTVIVDSTNAPSAWERAVEPSAPLVTPVKSFPEIPVKNMTSLALGVALPDPSSLSRTKYPGACKLVTDVKVIVVALSEIAPLRVVE